MKPSAKSKATRTSAKAKAAAKATKAAKGDKKYLAEVELLNRVKAHLEEGKSARSLEFTEEEQEIMSDIPLLSNKPIIYVANMSEDDFHNNIDGNKFYQEVLKIAAEEINSKNIY